MKLKTEYWPKPIALRYFDWQAWDADSYDGGDPVGSIARCLGHGATEAAAIEDWQQQWAEACDKEKKHMTPRAKLLYSSVKAGHHVILDDGFTCHEAGLVLIEKDAAGGLFFRCAAGRHNLIGQLDDQGYLIGMTLDDSDWDYERAAKAEQRKRDAAQGHDNDG